jgi:hypothetical protein
VHIHQSSIVLVRVKLVEGLSKAVAVGIGSVDFKKDARGVAPSHATRQGPASGVPREPLHEAGSDSSIASADPLQIHEHDAKRLGHPAEGLPCPSRLTTFVTVMTSGVKSNGPPDKRTVTWRPISTQKTLALSWRSRLFEHMTQSADRHVVSLQKYGPRSVSESACFTVHMKRPERHNGVPFDHSRRSIVSDVSANWIDIW